MAVQDREPPEDDVEAADRSWRLTEVSLLLTVVDASLTINTQAELSD